jgi:hypothetical protein
MRKYVSKPPPCPSANRHAVAPCSTPGPAWPMVHPVPAYTMRSTKIGHQSLETTVSANAPAGIEEGGATTPRPWGASEIAWLAEEAHR